jgi:hypothetical protein
VARAAEEAEDAAGAGMGVRVVSSLLETGRFDLGATLDLVTDPDMILGALGGLAGYTVAAQVAGLFLPPGIGMFARMLPRFAGSALGFELGRGSLAEADPIALMVQALVSTGGYAAAHLLLGATAPGWALMVGATLAGVAANLLIRPKGPSAVAATAPEPASVASLAEAEAEVGPGAPDAPEDADEAYRRVLEALEARTPDLEARYRRYSQVR